MVVLLGSLASVRTSSSPALSLLQLVVKGFRCFLFLFQCENCCGSLTFRRRIYWCWEASSLTDLNRTKLGCVCRALSRSILNLVSMHVLQSCCAEALKDWELLSLGFGRSLRFLWAVPGPGVSLGPSAGCPASHCFQPLAALLPPAWLRFPRLCRFPTEIARGMTTRALLTSFAFSIHLRCPLPRGSMPALPRHHGCAVFVQGPLAGSRLRK